MTLTAGAIPFDADTKVIVGTDSALVVTQTATTITAVVPAVAASPATVVISNLGPNQVASTFTAPVAAEAGEPDAFGATARPATIGANQYGVLTATDSEDWFRYDVTAASQLVTVNLRWPGVTGVAANDLDVLIFNAAHTQLSTTGNCESAALPETCSRTLTTGTYYFQVLRFNGTSSQPYRLLVN
jgi:hypothetical protein